MTGKDAVELDCLNEENNLILALSREHSDKYLPGRVTGHLDSLEISSRMHYYLCGLDAMIDRVTYWLEDKGISSSNIHREVFFHEQY